MKAALLGALRKIFTFANIVVTYCLAMMTVIVALTFYEYHRLDVPIPAEIIKIWAGFFGGELLTLAGRQILGSDVVKGKDDRGGAAASGGDGAGQDSI